MRTSIKVSLVAAGYVVAALIAEMAVSAHVARTVADSRGSDGMYAFGDLLLFVLVFGAAALAPTGLAVYFLLTRKSRGPQRGVVSPN